jgi:hypothetical protein
MPKLTAAQKAYSRAWAKEKRKDPAYRKLISSRTRKWQQSNPVKAALTAYRSRAKRQGLVFEFTDVDFKALIMQACHYCGLAASPLNGLDRVDSDLGYSYDNVVPACRQCNISKNNYTVAEFLSWAERVVNHNGG